MMIYGIIFLIFLVCVLIGFNISIFIKNKKLKLLNDALTSEVIDTKKAPILIGKITKYKESELQLLLSSPDLLDLLIRMFEYKIAIKTDTIRSLTDTERKVGYLDCLHEVWIQFLQLQKKLKKKEDKIGQDLV